MLFIDNFFQKLFIDKMYYFLTQKKDGRIVTFDWILAVWDYVFISCSKRKGRVRLRTNGVDFEASSKQSWKLFVL